MNRYVKEKGILRSCPFIRKYFWAIWNFKTLVCRLLQPITGENCEVSDINLAATD
jgi:hypothetical protein